VAAEEVEVAAEEEAEAAVVEAEESLSQRAPVPAQASERAPASEQAQAQESVWRPVSQQALQPAQVVASLRSLAPASLP
jgi:hypothetical protein